MIPLISCARSDSNATIRPLGVHRNMRSVVLQHGPRTVYHPLVPFDFRHDFLLHFQRWEGDLVSPAYTSLTIEAHVEALLCLSSVALAEYPKLRAMSRRRSIAILTVCVLEGGKFHIDMSCRLPKPIPFRYRPRATAEPCHSAETRRHPCQENIIVFINNCGLLRSQTDSSLVLVGTPSDSSLRSAIGTRKTLWDR